MSVEVKRVLSRVAGCCVLAIFAATSLPTLAGEVMPPPHTESVPTPEGIFCMDDMVTEPHSDELEPMPVSDVDGGCSVSELPVSV